VPCAADIGGPLQPNSQQSRENTQKSEKKTNPKTNNLAIVVKKYAITTYTKTEA